MQTSLRFEGIARRERGVSEGSVAAKGVRHESAALRLGQSEATGRTMLLIAEEPFGTVRAVFHNAAWEDLLKRARSLPEQNWLPCVFSVLLDPASAHPVVPWIEVSE